MNEAPASIRDSTASDGHRTATVPAGYKHTDAGVIPEDWNALRMGELANILRGASPRPINDPKWFDEESPTGWLRIADVTATLKYLDATSQNLSRAGVSNSRFVSSGSLVMSICATVGRPIITRKDVCIHDGFVVFNNPYADKEYLSVVSQQLCEQIQLVS